MASSKVYSAASFLIATASITSLVAPFVLSVALAESARAALTNAPWLGVVVALITIGWLFISWTAIHLFFRFATSWPLSTPSILILLCASAGFAGALAADGLVQLLSASLIMPSIALNTLPLVLGAALAFLVIAPATETLVMVLILEALRRLGLSGRNAALVSAAAWSGWHAFVNHPLQAPSILWLFWVLGTLYVRSRSSMSPVRAGVLVAGAHAGNNALAICFILGKQSMLFA